MSGWGLRERDGLIAAVVAPALVVGLAIGLATFAILSLYPSNDRPAASQPTLGEKIQAACGKLRLSDWTVDTNDPSLIHVTCYDPKTSDIKLSAVQR